MGKAWYLIVSIPDILLLHSFIKLVAKKAIKYEAFYLFSSAPLVNSIIYEHLICKILYLLHVHVVNLI